MKQPLKFYGLYSIPFPTEIEREMEVQIAPLGDWKGHYNGSFEVTPKLVASAVREKNKQSNDIVFDLEHASLYANFAPAMGWGTELLNKKKDGLWAKVVWQETVPVDGHDVDVLKMLGNKGYRFISPVLEFDMPDRVTAKPVAMRIHSVAVTNTPFIDAMPIAAKDGTKVVLLSADNKEDIMDKALLITLLGLDEDADEQAIEEALIALKGADGTVPTDVLAGLGLVEGASVEDAVARAKELNKETELPKTPDAPTPDDKEPSGELAEVVQAMKVMGATIADMQKTTETFVKNDTERSVRDLVEQARNDRKLTAGMLPRARIDAEKDPEAFVARMKVAPIVVPPDGPLPEYDLKDGGQTIADPVDNQIRLKCGINDEDWKKYGPGSQAEKEYNDRIVEDQEKAA